MAEILLPNDYPDGERFSRTKKSFERGALREIGFGKNKLKAKVYSWQMAALFALSNNKTIDGNGQQISQFRLLEAYYNGFTQGLAKFKELYPVSLFFADQKQYVQTLHYACYHTDPITGKHEKRWSKMINSWLEMFTSFEMLKQFGFYAGLYSGVTEMKSIYPIPFTNLEKCYLQHPDQLSDLAKDKADVIDVKATAPKHKPSENERKALYKFYMDEILKRNDPLYKLWNRWSKKDYRQQSNQSLKTYNSKKGHMEAVTIRVLSEKKPGYEKRANAINADIEALTTNFNKKVPL